MAFKTKEQKRWSQVKLKFGLTKEEWELKLKQQNFSCAICKTHVSKLDRNLCVDHNHETNTIRGLLCRTCNAGLGLLKDSPEILETALTYLKFYRP